MEFFKKQTNIDFLGLQRWAAALSLILILISVVSLLTKGLHWGLDFTGGSQLQISFKHSVELPKIRQTLEQLGYKDCLLYTSDAADE